MPKSGTIWKVALNEVNGEILGPWGGDFEPIGRNDYPPNTVNLDLIFEVDDKLLVLDSIPENTIMISCIGRPNLKDELTRILVGHDKVIVGTRYFGSYFVPL